MPQETNNCVLHTVSGSSDLEREMLLMVVMETTWLSNQEV